MSIKIMLLALFVMFSCNRSSKTVVLKSVEDKQLSSILGRQVIYPDLPAGEEMGNCLCIIDNAKGPELEKASCEVPCNNKFKLNCPYRQAGMGYKDFAPHPDLKKINQYFFQQKGERTKHALIADKALDYLERVRNICFIGKRVSGEYEIHMK